jgi:hypothetical protein
MYHQRTFERSDQAMKPHRKPHVLDKKRIGKFSEGLKGPFAPDIVSRIWIILYHLARKKTGMSLEELRTELNTYFSDYFGKRTLNSVPSDKFRRTLLVDRMVDRIEEIRTFGKAKTPLWN